MTCTRLLSFVAAVAARTATVSNEALPLDQNVQPIITGEASVLAHNGRFYFVRAVFKL